MRNFEWWRFYGFWSKDVLWVRFDPLEYGLEIVLWKSIKILRAK